MSSLINPAVHAEPTVDSMLHEAARTFIAERRDFTAMDLGPLFQRLAAEAFDIEHRRHCLRQATAANPTSRPSNGSIRLRQVLPGGNIVCDFLSTRHINSRKETR